MPNTRENLEGSNSKNPYGSFFLSGLIGGLFADTISYLAAASFGLPYPPEAIFQLLVSPVPGSVESRLVETLGELPKYGTYAFSVVLYTVFYGAVAVAVGYLFQTKRITSRPLLLSVAIAIPTVIGLGFQAGLAASTIALGSIMGWLIATVIMVVANLVFAKIVVDSFRVTRIGTGSAQMASASASVQPSSPSRRSFLKKAAFASAAIVLATVVSWMGFSVLSGQPISSSGSPIPIDNSPTSPDLAGLPSVFRDPRISDLLASEITDSRVFYRIDIDPIPPQIDLAHWTLNISGKVNSPFVVDQNSLMTLPVTDEYATLECVSNTIDPPGGLISNAKWTGVNISTILKRAGVAPEAKYVVFHCADGYTVGVPLESALASGALLAFKMDDQPLPAEHGFPLRAIVPGIYGMMNAKWIREIELTDQVYLGYWQERGWTNDAMIKTTSLIYYPTVGAQVSGSIPIAGVAFAGDRGISRVEVSTDAGKTWNEALIKPPLSPYSWVLWALEWSPSNKGDHTILVRATDGTGQLQDPTSRPNFPDGATGYHSISVNVR
jgi:DMSO/TMAO reductase YedYZ molybdopterin-dependent catalytic subunit